MQDLNQTKREYHLIELYPFQEDAAKKLKNGSILVGNTGSGKSATSVYYYIHNEFERDLYIITTAKKRDKGEWIDELMNFDICPDPELNHNQKVVIDSWNNIGKYKKVYGAFFIFDEQRVVGSGTWVKAFLKIAKANHWILLSATPGDKYEDYIPVLVANGFYKHKTEFWNEHIIQKPYVNYQAVGGYRNTGKINYYISKILVRMKDPRETNHYNIKCSVEYSKELYKTVWKDRWNPYDNEPIAETGKLLSLLRQVVNSDQTRINKLCELVNKIDKVIIFYNFDYELEILRKCMKDMNVPYTEWNGHKHEEIITGERWAYLVQYTAGAEGWNCIETNSIIFYSQTYSYRSREQAKGRIDRLNTPFHDLYYYHLVSYAPIDVAISRALSMKRNFNERTFMKAQK